MLNRQTAKWSVYAIMFLACMIAVAIPTGAAGTAAAQAPESTAGYVVLTWNDLGMHCDNPRFQDLAVLPPYSNLYAQVIQVADPPQLVTSGITVRYSIIDNTYSVGKTDFWDTSPYQGVQNAQWLFGLAQPLPPNVGLTGKGLSGFMDLSGDHFVAEGIPITEYRDSAPTVSYPYQLAAVRVFDTNTGALLAQSKPVVPVSSEMHCENCHYDNGPGNEGVATGVVDQNILTKHDQENDYPPGHPGPLMGRRPILCAECHSSNALGLPGVPGLPSFSNAMHDKHKELVPDTLAGCYNCHPGPQTQCLRDVMSNEYGMDCIDCHGGMAQVAQNPNPWLNEPRCDSSGCHGSAFQQNQPLYRQSTEHGGVYCEACHDSTHAIAPSREYNDSIKFVRWQGHNGPLDNCLVCHASQPTGPGPHQVAQPKIFVRDIRALYKAIPGGFALQAKVLIYNAANQPVSGATVTGQWRMPSGTISPVTAVTGTSGWATLKVTSAEHGQYTFSVTDVQASGYTYDPAMNRRTSVTLTIP